MNRDKIATLLRGIAAINRILIQETEGDAFFAAVTARFTDTLIMAGTGLQSVFYSEAPTEDDMAACVVENMAETRTFPAIIVYDKFGNEVSA